MKSKSIRTVLATAIVAALGALGAASTVQAADIIPVVFDAAGTGYNDPTPIAPVGGNPGTTVGAQRTYVAQYAAALWGSVLQSNVPIYIGARFTALGPNVLGSAGSASAFRDYPNMVPGTWYGGALGDALTGTDLRPGFVDINSNFSTAFPFYYGLDGNTPAGMTNFLDVVMHEYAHGLGFASFGSAANGTLFNGLQDAYNRYAYSNAISKFWPAMTNAERQAQAVNTGQVVFTGPRAVAGAQLLLNKRIYFRATAPAAAAGDYAYGTASFGPPATPANYSGQVVLATDAADAAGLSTTDGCSPITSDVVGKIALMDRGTCGFAIKAKNAQNAGAKAVLIADNVTAAVAGMSGTDNTITIPSLRVTLATGNTFKANLPVTVGLIQDPVLLQGADDTGRPRLYAPNPVETGSSFSHYDNVAEPNLLMEPAINGSLRSYYNLDITPALMADIGWTLNTGTAKISSPRVTPCDTGVGIVNNGGLIVGGTVQAANEICLISAQTKQGYFSCMQAAASRYVATSLLNTTQANKMMVCARRVSDYQNFPL